MFDLTLLSTQEPLVVGGGFGLVGLSGLLGGIGGGNVMLKSLIWVSESVSRKFLTVVGHCFKMYEPKSSKRNITLMSLCKV